MSFSSIAVQQREKEAQSLRSFLAWSLIGSLGLHLGVLTLGLSNLWHRSPELEEEPLEIVIVDPPPTPEAVKPQEPQETLPERQTEGGSSRIGSQSNPKANIEVVRPKAAPAPSSPPKAATRPVPQPAPSVAPSPPPPAVTAEKQPAPITPDRTQKLVEDLKREPAPQQKPAPIPQPAPVAVDRPPQKPQPAAPPAQTQPQENANLRNTLGEIRNTTESQATAPQSAAGSGNRTGTATTGNGTSSSGQGSGRSTGQAAGSGSSVATGPGAARQGTPQGEGSGSGDPTGSGSGRLSCRNCSKPKYPEQARKRGVEGSAKIKVDVDDKGNVTNVRVAESSGNRDLDEAAVRAARRWKFDTPNGARQGVSAKVDFELENSERSRRNRERRRKTEAARKNARLKPLPRHLNVLPHLAALQQVRNHRQQLNLPSLLQVHHHVNLKLLHRDDSGCQLNLPTVHNNSKLHPKIRIGCGNLYAASVSNLNHKTARNNQLHPIVRLNYANLYVACNKIRSNQRHQRRGEG